MSCDVAAKRVLLEMLAPHTSGGIFKIVGCLMREAIVQYNPQNKIMLVMGGSICRKMFNAGRYLKGFSLGDDAAKLLVGNSFTCLNTANFMKQCIRTSAFEWAHGKGFEKLKLLWTNKLFAKGTVVSHREGLVDNTALLVVSVSEHGFVGW